MNVSSIMIHYKCISIMKEFKCIIPHTAYIFAYYVTSKSMFF